MNITSDKIRVATKDLFHIVLLFVLIFALLFAYSLFTRCGNIPLPGWCDIYWSILRYDNGGNPRVLIVYGDGGLGDHELLANIIQDPQHVGKRVFVRHIEEVSLGNLKNYDLVIVEECRRMSTDKMKMFIDYAISGGKKLVWIGDAGTELYQGDEMVKWKEHPEYDKNSDEPISPWIRKKGENIISLEALLGVRYKTNYCDIKECKSSELPWVGTLNAEDRTHKLVRGIKADLQMYGNFSIVEVISSAETKKVLDVDFGSSLITKDGNSLGRYFPIIVTSGFGENIAYYAIPPETMASDKMPKNEEGEVLRYYSLVEKLYYGMLY
ncbi:MAG: hypothetical protein N3D73_00330 [Candidatus Diapherotrites archaeon]|nr:hypothetical protein [Candidatus Diapherotrites archaeon]